MEHISRSGADRLAKLCQEIIDMIEIEQNLPLTPGQTAFRIGCDAHPNAVFPLRATEQGAAEDSASHLNSPGCHCTRLYEEIVPENQPQPSLAHTHASPSCSFVETLALDWAEKDAPMRWVLDAPDARPISPEALLDIAASYLAEHDPFPEGTSVDVARRDSSGWDRARVVERTGNNEWTVEFLDGETAWRDHSELRPSQAV